MNYLLKTILLLVIISFLLPAPSVMAQEAGSFEIARVKYRGGGDWYNDPSSLSNLISFTRSRVPVQISSQYKDVSLGSVEIHSYPFLFMTGHGNITVNDSEIRNIRSYLNNGGFLYIDDDYGLDEYIRPILKEVFPDEELVEIPFDHPIYHQLFDFAQGVPKIHEHDNNSPRGYGIFREGRLVVYYTWESNLGDGWADPEVHNDPPEVRRKALEMGANILVYALTQQ